jgi:Crp-like helix-turn-helix protein
LSGRPQNNLLQHLSPDDFDLLASHLQLVEASANEVLHHPGDAMEIVHFPCGPTLLSFAVAVDDDREVESLLIGREGAAGGVISQGFSPAYSRVVVRVGGTIARLPVRAFGRALQNSAALREIFAKYSHCQVAQLLQSSACNAAHSIEQRAAKWIIAALEHIGSDALPLTHEQLAGLLGVSRSYASRVIQTFKAKHILATRRGSILVRDPRALEASACSCNAAVKRHFGEVLRGVHPGER